MRVASILLCLFLVSCSTIRDTGLVVFTLAIPNVLSKVLPQNPGDAHWRVSCDAETIWRFETEEEAQRQAEHLREFGYKQCIVSDSIVVWVPEKNNG